MDVEVVAQYRCEVGEGPLWHPKEKFLYWTDIDGGRLFRYDVKTGEHGVVLEGRPVGGFTYQADGSLLLFRDRGTVQVFRDGKVVKTIIEQIPGEVDTRFNDVIADPRGRVFCGTMSTDDRKGRLYCLDTDGSYRVVFEDIGCSNGMGFTLDLKQMYYTDSLANTIWVYDYDEATGELTNQRVLAKTESPALPDGLTVDANGDIWSAQWEGGRVVCYGPDGNVKQTIDLPAAKITSVMFGGEDLSDLYITSAAYGGDGETNPQYAGALFRVKPGVQGRVEFPSRIGL